MYDFCLTLPYAALLALGGLIGFFTKGSLPSLMGGLGSALILAIAGQRSFSYYHQAGFNSFLHLFNPSCDMAVNKSAAAAAT